MRKRAFTLIELLVVIAIIALLLSVIVPALRKAKDAVKRVVCSSSIRQVGIAVRSYAETYDGKMIPMPHIGGTVDYYSDSIPGTVTPNATGPIEPWMGVVSQILNAFGVVQTPRPKGLNLGVLYDLGIISSPETFYCPAQPLASPT